MKKLKQGKRPFGGKHTGAERVVERPPPAGGWPPCYADGCSADGKNTHACLTCEKLGKSTEIHYCPAHRETGLGQIKKHALVRHPANLLRVIGAGLAGEDIT